MELNTTFITMGLNQLLEEDRVAFINKLAIIFQSKTGLLNFLSSPMPTLSEAEAIEYIKAQLPIPDNFRSIELIQPYFNWEFEFSWSVSYRYIAYANPRSKDKSVYCETRKVSEDNFTEETIREEIIIIPQKKNK